MARACSTAYLAERERLGFPLLKDPAARAALGLDQEVADHE